MKQLKAKAIVLSRIDYGEADRIVTFLSPDQGKIKVLAKSVRRPKSKLAGGIELFSICTIVYIVGKGSLSTLISARLEQHFENITKDINKTMYAYEVLKILNKVMEDEAGQVYYDLLEQTLSSLDKPENPKELSELSFSLGLMHLLGHIPDFSVDASGQKLPMAESYNFNFENMSFWPSEEGRYSLNHIKFLKVLSFNPVSVAKQINNYQQYLNDLLLLVRQIFNQAIV